MRTMTGILAAALLAGAAAGRADPPAAAPAAAEGRVDFRFDDADLRLLVRLVGETTGRRFVLDERVRGQVTVVSPVPVAREELYPLLVAILESRGFSIVERDGTHFVVPLPERPLPAAPTRTAPAPPGSGLSTRVFRLVHVDAVDVARTLEPMVPAARAGAVAAFAASNHLAVTDTAAGLERIEAVIESLDRAGATRSIEVIPLQHASAEEVAEQLMTALQGMRRAGEHISRHLRQVADGLSAMPAETLVIPAAQANSLLLIGAPAHIEELKAIIPQLDQEPVSGHGRLNAVFLRYLAAEDAAKSLNALLARSAERDQRQRIALEANVASNAILVDASPRDFQWLRGLIESLDRPPQQVLVEVVIAEVSMDRQLDLGVEWSTVEAPAEGRTVVLGRSRPGETDLIMDAVTQGLFPRGLGLGVAHGVDGQGMPRVAFLLRALQEQRDVRILSSVPLWAQNNREASVEVVDNIPILSSVIEGAGVTRDVIQNIERMDVGIRLSITPHINPDREITLQLNPSIEAIIAEGPPDTPFTPTIARREISTTITVPDLTTVVISGLMREDRVKREGRVPVLGRLPFLGMLFRSSQDRTQRSNLLVFVTPRIVTEPDASREARADLEARTGLQGPEVRGAVEAVEPP